MINQHTKAALRRAIDLKGGLTQLAAAMNTAQVSKPATHYTPQHIYNWSHRGVPAARLVCIHIELATDGEVRREELRPDVFGGS